MLPFKVAISYSSYSKFLTYAKAPAGGICSDYESRIPLFRLVFLLPC